MGKGRRGPVVSAEPDPPVIDVQGRDEMNLAEFPIAALTDHVPRGCNTIRFGDASGSVMITGSDAYGLPTPADADVIVALIQLTKRRNGFTAPTVPFRRAEVLAILGWPESGKSYRRLTESLMRWSTTSLKFEGTWWDQKSRRKLTAMFHILNEVILVDRADPGDGDSPTGSQPQSYFAWNQIFLSSCQAGNLKRLDLGMYFALEHASSKRLYRFLDKRLQRQPDQTFDLAEVAFERVGLSRGYVGKKGGINIAKVREKLRPAIEELEARGFLVHLSPEDRYQKRDTGWTIRFVRTGEPRPAEVDSEERSDIAAVLDLVPTSDPNERDATVEQLQARGVTRTKAERIAAQYPVATIAEKLAIFDWKRTADPSGLKRNPAGWLVRSIEDGYEPPAGFRSQQEGEEPSGSVSGQAAL